MTKPKLACLCFSILLYSLCLSQKDNSNRRDSIRILNARNHYFNLLLDKRRVKKKLPVRRLEFADMRYDTTFIALNWRVPLFNGGILKDKFNLNGGLATHLTNFYRYQYLQDTSGNENTLICFIKEFSVTPKQDVLNHFFQSPSLTNMPDNNIHIDIECFLQHGDSLYPAMQFDTTYRIHFLVRQTHFTEAVEDMLQPFEDKLEHLDTEAVMKRKHYTEAIVKSRYLQRFGIPVLARDHFKKGIYKNITELRNQTPSIDSFSASLDKMKVRAAAMDNIVPSALLLKAIQKRNTSVFLYDAGGELINPSNIFAYCPDGETIWIQHGALYYPLVRVGNGFEFLFIYHVPDQNGNTATIIILMPLNIDTGQSN